jgi:hypothetical protein
VSTAAAAVQATPETSQEPSCEAVTSYVTASIEGRWGPQLPGPDPAAVIAGFCERLGAAKAMMIAQAAFEVHGGLWRGAPVTIKRFTEGHDSFFAFPLLSGIA